jgi:hypothetical protein
VTMYIWGPDTYQAVDVLTAEMLRL